MAISLSELPGVPSPLGRFTVCVNTCEPPAGTSSAAPVVAGIAGLLFSYNPSLTNAQVEQALEASAAPVSFTVQYGRVDALAALQYLGASDPQPSSAPVQTDAPKIYYTLNGLTSIAPLTTAPQVGQMLVRGIGGWKGSSGLTVSNLEWQRCDTSGAACSIGGAGGGPSSGIGWRRRVQRQRRTRSRSVLPDTPWSRPMSSTGLSVCSYS